VVVSRPLVLITNDDGVHAPGLLALRRALEPVVDVYVVAPDREVSACAQSLTIKNPLRAQPVDATTWAIDGTPADCVNLGVVKLLPRRPDLVVSGINRGANLGDDVFYSGTVAGAREALFFGLPAIAFSLAARAAHSYAHAAAYAARLVPRVVRDGLPADTLLNVNVPAGRPRGVRVTVQGRRSHQGTVFEGLDPRRRTYYWIEEGRDEWGEDPRADIYAVRAGFVSVTPLHTDTTNYAALDALARLQTRPRRR
jgi:5'-nucleotidase